MSLNGSRPNLDTYALMTAIWKIWSELPRAFTPYGLGAKNRFWADFKIWPNIPVQWNMISTIGKKLANLQVWWTFVQKRLRTVGEFFPTT